VDTSHWTQLEMYQISLSACNQDKENFSYKGISKSYQTVTF